jgi:hypothetical protein
MTLPKSKTAGSERSFCRIRERWLLPISSSLIVFLVLLNGIAIAQTSSTGTALGTVTDQSGAAVVRAEVEITNVATGSVLKTMSGSSGQYTFPNLLPGTYTIVVTKEGFRRASLTVEITVDKSVLGDFGLEVGQVNEKVEVHSGGIELQTLSSSVGSVVERHELEELPTSQRKSTQMLFFQPATTPANGYATNNGAYSEGQGGSVAGARSDQNTATLDGVIITDYTGGGNITGTVSWMSLPVDAIEEFRGSVANPDSSRSSGGQFNFTTRQGTKDWHGAGYWYHQNDEADANSWDNNSRGQARPELKDNRFGGRFGGPIWKEKTFFSLFYEARRFPQSQPASRTGISESLRQGILEFRDASGNVVNYNLNPANGPLSALCGPTGNAACDPRGIGISPVINQLFALYPKGNNPSIGDGLNTVGISSPVNTGLRDDIALGRIDHNLNDKWRLNASYMWQLHNNNDSNQLDFNPSVTGGALLKSTSDTANKDRFVTVGASGVLTPNVNVDFRFGWVRQEINFDRALAQPLFQAAGTALELTDGSGILSSPGDPGSRFARPQFRKVTIPSFSSTITRLHGNHFFTAGFSLQLPESFHARFDRVNSNVFPAAEITGDQFQPIPAADRPPTCGGSLTTNCLSPNDVNRWDALYASILGIWDNTQTFTLRDANGNPIPPGPIATDDHWKHFDISGSDAWRINRSLTLSYGVDFIIETPLSDTQGRQAFIVNASTGALINPKAELAAKLQAAAQGNAFNEPFAFVPTSTLHRGIYNKLYHASPRAGLAWNPSFSNGPLSKLFGDRKTVLRGGFSLLYDSILTVINQEASMNGNQLLATSAGLTAPSCALSATPGVNCTPGTPYRVGVDGPAFLPAAVPFGVPFVPASATSTNRTFGVLGGFGIDPNLTVGHTYGGDLTVQRELPKNFLLEIGWIGRYARNQSGALDLAAPPTNIMDVTHKSNQTFAQAFDAIGAQLRSGIPASAVTPQPWFENLYGAGGTTAIAAAAGNSFTSVSITPLFQSNFGSLHGIDAQMLSLGLAPIDNQQYSDMPYYTNFAWSNYNALFVSLHQRTWHGLTNTFNYTWSHCLDIGGIDENSAGAPVDNPYNPGFDYGDCFADTRHQVRAYGVYDIPGPANKLRRLLSGWAGAYVFTSNTGFPLIIYQSRDLFGPNQNGEESVRIATPVSNSVGVNHTTGSNGIGTAGNLNVFSDPAKVFNSLRPFLLSTDTRTGRGNFHGLGYWNLDLSLGKRTQITERISARISVDAFNVLNKVNFITNRFSITDPAGFGVINSSLTPGNTSADSGVGARRLQLGLRLEF